MILTEVTVAEVIIVHVEDTVTVSAEDMPRGPDGERGFKPVLVLTGSEILGVPIGIATGASVLLSG